jgi:hypothetical protein
LKEFSINHGSHLEGVLRSKFGRKTNFEIKGLLSHKNGIYIGQKKFRSLQEVKGIFNKILKSYTSGQNLSEDDEEMVKGLI